jgi:uncharacterized protein (TIGR00730 family)
MNWPKKSYENQHFLNSERARTIRILCELTEPIDRFKSEAIEKTIVLFGSARTLHPEEAQKVLKDVEEEIAQTTNPSLDLLNKKQQAIIGVKSSPYYAAARELSKKLTEWSLALPENSRYTICSGGGPGIMEAANRGALDANGKSIGLGISLPFEQGVNDYIPKELQFEFHYFFIRKYWFVLLAKALVAFPGGFGTLDELFETLTLLQTGKINGRKPIILFGSEFWNRLIHFDTLIEWGMISEKDVNLIHITDSVDDAFDCIVQQLDREET